MKYLMKMVFVTPVFLRGKTNKKQKSKIVNCRYSEQIMYENFYFRNGTL